MINYYIKKKYNRKEPSANKNDIFSNKSLNKIFKRNNIKNKSLAENNNSTFFIYETYKKDSEKIISEYKYINNKVNSNLDYINFLNIKEKNIKQKWIEDVKYKNIKITKEFKEKEKELQNIKKLNNDILANNKKIRNKINLMRKERSVADKIYTTFENELNKNKKELFKLIMANKKINLIKDSMNMKYAKFLNLIKNSEKKNQNEIKNIMEKIENKNKKNTTIINKNSNYMKIEGNLRNNISYLKVNNYDFNNKLLNTNKKKQLVIDYLKIKLNKIYDLKNYEIIKNKENNELFNKINKNNDCIEKLYHTYSSLIYKENDLNWYKNDNNYLIEIKKKQELIKTKKNKLKILIKSNKKNKNKIDFINNNISKIIDLLGLKNYVKDDKEWFQQLNNFIHKLNNKFLKFVSQRNISFKNLNNLNKDIYQRQTSFSKLVIRNNSLNLKSDEVFTKKLKEFKKFINHNLKKLN